MEWSEVKIDWYVEYQKPTFNDVLYVKRDVEEKFLKFLHDEIFEKHRIDVAPDYYRVVEYFFKKWNKLYHFIYKNYNNKRNGRINVGVEEIKNNLGFSNKMKASRYLKRMIDDGYIKITHKYLCIIYKDRKKEPKKILTNEYDWIDGRFFRFYEQSEQE